MAPPYVVVWRLSVWASLDAASYAIAVLVQAYTLGRVVDGV